MKAIAQILSRDAVAINFFLKVHWPLVKLSKQSKASENYHGQKQIFSTWNLVVAYFRSKKPRWVVSIQYSLRILYYFDSKLAYHFIKCDFQCTWYYSSLILRIKFGLPSGLWITSWIIVCTVKSFAWTTELIKMKVITTIMTVCAAILNNAKTIQWAQRKRGMQHTVTTSTSQAGQMKLPQTDQADSNKNDGVENMFEGFMISALLIKNLSKLQQTFYSNQYIFWLCWLF